MNVAELLTIPASAFPDQELLRFEGHGRTYAETVDRVERMAGALRDLGVQPGDRVAVLETNAPAVVELLFATALRGATFVPLNYRAGAEELAHMLDVASPRLVLVGERYWRDALDSLEPGPGRGGQLMPLEPVTADRPDLATLASQSEPDPSDVELHDAGSAVVLFTSGTTARAKGVMLGHQDLTGYVISSVDLASGEDVGSVAVAAPVYHIAGLMAVLSATFSGRRVVLMRQFDATEWLRLVERERVTHAFLVPTMLKRVLDHPDFDSDKLSSLRVVSYGAAPMPTAVIRRAIEQMPRHVDFMNAFGQTETTSTVTVLGPEDHRLVGSLDEVEARLRRLASVGRPLPDIEIRILDAEGNELAAGEVGEIAIRSDRLMRGYYGQEDATAATFRDDWLLTRDLGWLDDSGYLFLAGRKSDMIIRGGENIAPEEVEVVLASHPAVEEAVVVGLPSVEWGEVVAAAVVKHAGARVTEEELIEFCRQRIASFKKPERVTFVHELPRNALGKVLRRNIRTAFTAPLPIDSD